MVSERKGGIGAEMLFCGMEIAFETEQGLFSLKKESAT
jgi:hypothetical protein